MSCQPVRGLGALLLFFILTPAHAEANTTAVDQACLAGFLETGADSLTLGEMRTRCRADVNPADEEPSRVKARIAEDRATAARPYALLAHKPNYILAAAWNERGWNEALLQRVEPDIQNEDVEVQFQFSFKVPLAINLFDGHMDLYAAYTNRSFWQAYNSLNSEPFRETNHEPEFWAQFQNDWDIWGVTNVINSVGVVHQSNGRSDPLSRSWNRLYANFIFEKDDFVLSLKPWLWISQDKESSDNPDIDDFMGHGEIRAAWARNGHVLSGMLRNQIESGFERGAVEASWSFPVFNYPYLKGYLQYFYGYGESLIDYNQRVNRIGLGISMTDWLD